MLTSRPAVTPDTACPINFYGKQGYYICGTMHPTITYSSGRHEAFVIGLDHAVWHAWQGSGGGVYGWSSMGGQACSFSSGCGVYADQAFLLRRPAGALALGPC